MAPTPKIYDIVKGTQETEVDSTLAQTSVGIMRAAIVPYTRKATAEVVSEDEDLMVPIEALDNLEGPLSKGSSLKRYSYSLPLQNKPKN